MLALAFRAGIPLVAVETDDTINIAQVLAEVAGQNVAEAQLSGKLPSFPEKINYVVCGKDAYNYPNLYRFMAKGGKTLVFVNPPGADDSLFNAGVVPLPKKLLHNFLSQIVEDGSIDSVSTVLGGLSLKTVSEVCMLSMAQYGELTVRGVVETRRKIFGNIRGLHQVSTKYDLYIPNAELKGWLDIDGAIFKSGGPAALMPRGLLLHGLPGTGKSLGAKYISNQLQVPLYRLDLSGVLGKYVGQSEQSMARVLGLLEQSAPCVLLIDEVEKLFQANEDGGVTSRILSALLWWLQEHDKPIVSILTTNGKNKLPKELIRPGRVDKVIEVQGVAGAEEAAKFGSLVLESLSKGIKISEHEKKLIIHNLNLRLGKLTADEWTQARITQIITDALKYYVVNNGLL